MARKYKRRTRKGLAKKVKAIVKHEVGKTRETQKLVSYLSWSSVPGLLDNTAGDRQGLLISLTGGISPQDSQTVLTPGVYSDKQLFKLLPAGSTLSTDNVQQAGQGGAQMQQTAGGVVTSAAIGGIHSLEGRQCWLKTWYASIIMSNSPQQVVDPRPCFVRMIVFQTRRPLASEDLAQQIFLQNHAVAAMNATVSDEPETVNSYINRDIVSKVYYDRLIKLTGPTGAQGEGASSAQLYTTKIKVRLNKRARWTYYYATRDPVQADESLSYMGPFIYAVFLGNQNNSDRFPQMAMNTMLTFYDD